MKYTYEQPEYLDVDGARHLVQELKVYIQEILNGNIDITQYATKEELSNAVSSIDLTDYAKTSDIPSLDGYAKSTDIPSLDGYATKSYVDENIANVTTGGEVDLSNYVTKDTVYTKEDVYTKAETNALIPSTEGLATETYVDNAVSNVPTTDLTGYATEEYVSTAINSIPATDLSNYYTKSETYSKTEVDTLVANSGGGSSSGSGEVYSTEEVAIGKWIDGSTIYRKVFEMTIRSDIQNGTPIITSIEHGIENFNQLVDLRCINNNSSMKTSIGAYGLMPVNLTNLSSWTNIKNYSIRSAVTKTKIMIDAGVRWKGAVITVIVEYTKTV